jgi:hypothetical protein
MQAKQSGEPFFVPTARCCINNNHLAAEAVINYTNVWITFFYRQNELTEMFKSRYNQLL